MAVTVSSKTLEATTLVMQSDLDVIVKSSRDEVFVFAENMLTGKPWPGAQLLVSNGQEVIGEGDDRRGRRVPEELQGAEAADRQPGGKHLRLARRRVPQRDAGLQRRPRLRRGRRQRGLEPGQPARRRRGPRADRQGLHLHRPPGLPRRPAGPRPRLPAPRGRRRLHDREGQEVHASRSSTAATGRCARRRSSWTTSAASTPTSSCRPTARRASIACWSTTTARRTTRARSRSTSTSLSRSAWWSIRRGASIIAASRSKAPIRAEFYYGAPVVGREIRYQLADDRFETATTDAKGEVQFKLPTREFSETQVLPLMVQMPERNVQRAVNFILAAQGFSIGVEHGAAGLRGRRDVRGDRQHQRRRGQAARAEAHAQGAGADHGRRAVGERLVEEHELTTAADGTARKTLKLDKGGVYFLRAEAIDRFQNPISGQAAVQISDEDDLVRLRILADKHTYKVGDTAAVEVALARAAGAGAGDLPRRAGAGLSARRVEDRGQRAGDPHDRPPWRRISSWPWR